jgi:hypothetical protein
LALFVPIAWKMLCFRALSRGPHPTPAAAVLSATQRQVLEAMLQRHVAEDTSAAEALLLIAELGGHIRSNGAPGWQVIGRGYQEMLLFEAGWCAAKGLPRSDQS